MLRWTAGGDHGLSVLIHHTDAQREYKYSPNTLFRLGKNTLTYAKLENWLVVDMKSDWARIFKQKK
jgi:hypothetical protein